VEAWEKGGNKPRPLPGGGLSSFGMIRAFCGACKPRRKAIHKGRSIIIIEATKAIGSKKYLPNIVSITRIAGTAVLPFLVKQETTVYLPLIDRAFQNVPYVWVIVYLILVLTDKADGALARKLKAESELGANLDSLGDVFLLVMGATTCFVRFVAAQLATWEFWLYVGMMICTVVNKVLVFLVAKKFHGKGNMAHTYFQKSFAVGCFIAVAYWAFVRNIPAWSIRSLLAINIYATIDECVYCVRSAEYNIDFKGHGFEKYPLRKK
jgi:phosphatidylglycerophosphate synthase